MKLIKIKSNTYSYIIIRDVVLSYMEEGEIDVDILLLSELESIENLYVRGLLFVSEADILYIRDKIKILSCECEGGGPIEGDFIPLNQKGVANGVATLDIDGFVPMSQLNIPESSGPFIVKEWDAYNAEVTDIPSKLSDNVLEEDLGNNKYKLGFKGLDPSEKYLQNTFFTSSSNLTYVNGILSYNGPVTETPITIPYIGFNNIIDVHTRTVRTTGSSISYQLLVTQEGDPAKLLTGESVFYPYLSVIVGSNGDLTVTSKDGETRTIKMYGSTFFNITHQGNGLVQLETSSGIYSYDLNTKENYDPDLPWNAFFLINEPIVPGTGEYAEKFELEVTRKPNSKFGGKHFEGIVQDFEIILDPLPIPPNGDYFYNFLFSDTISTEPLEFTSGTYFMFDSGSGSIMIMDVALETSEVVMYDNTQPLTITVEGSKNRLKILNKIVPVTANDWKSFGIYWSNESSGSVISELVEISYTLNNFKKEIIKESVLPVDAEDGDTLKVISNGLYKNQNLVEGDFVTVYNDTDIIVTRLPSVDMSDVETMVDFKILAMQAECKEYVQQQINSLKSVYRGRFLSVVNIHVTDPRDGDYVLIGSDASDLSTLYYNSTTRLWEKSGSVLSTDNVPEGLRNKYYKDSLVQRYLNDYSYFNKVGFDNLMISKEITPRGFFESTERRVDDIFSVGETNLSIRYPSVKATIDYVSKYFEEDKLNIPLKSKGYFNIAFNGTTKITKHKGDYFDGVVDTTTYEPFKLNFKATKQLTVTGEYLYNSGEPFIQYPLDQIDGFSLEICTYAKFMDTGNGYDYRIGIKFGEGNIETETPNYDIGSIYCKFIHENNRLIYKSVSSVVPPVSKDINLSTTPYLIYVNLYYDGKDLKFYSRTREGKKQLIDTVVNFNTSYLGGKTPTYITIFGQDLSTVNIPLVERLDLSFVPLIKVDL